MIELQEVDQKRYYDTFSRAAHVYVSEPFIRLNAARAAAIRYLIAMDANNGRARAGIVLGEDHEGALQSPFSAPFGGFDTLRPLSTEVIDEIVVALLAYCQTMGKTLHITLPPLLYSPTQLIKWASALSRVGTTDFIDLNYHFTLSHVADYLSHVHHSAIATTRQALKAPLSFQRLNAEDPADIARAYSVIQANHESRGYPVRMSLQQVIDTASILEADFFVLTCKDDATGVTTDVAAAQIHHVAPGIVQVVYWGDRPGFSHLRSMNALAYHLFEHYAERQFTILDIGPSTLHGVPNHGLCTFKEHIGCDITPRYSFTLR